VTPGVYDPISNGNADIFAARFDLGQPGAAALVYATYLGGSDSDFGYDLAVDSAGNAYIGGYTYSPDAPTHNAYQSVPANSGYTDAYIAKLDPSGSTLLYATYLGGSGFDRGWQLAVDDLGNVYQTGETSSTDFSTRNAYQDARNGSRSAFLASIDTTQGGVASLLYATYLGGLGLDTGHGIAHAGGRRVYVTGWTTSPDFPVTPYAYDPTCGTDGHCNYDTYRRSDAFITEIDTSRSGAASLLQSTFLGGSRDDQGLAIALDADGDGDLSFEETMHRTCGTVAIQDGLLFVADFSGLFHCLDVKTGKPLWAFDMLAASWGSPLITDGKVYIGDEDGDIAIFELAPEMNLLAEVNMGNSVYSTPIAVGDTLYIANKSHLFAIREGAEPIVGDR